MPSDLLDTPPDAQPNRLSVFRKVFLGLEISGWALALLAWQLKSASWEYGSEILIVALAFLAFLYLLFPILLLGSRGWKQHLVSHVTGLMLMLAVFGLLFRLERWAYAAELNMTPVLFCGLLFAATTVIWITRRNTPGKGIFYRNAALRLGIAEIIVLLCLGAEGLRPLI